MRKWMIWEVNLPVATAFFKWWEVEHRSIWVQNLYPWPLLFYHLSKYSFLFFFFLRLIMRAGILFFLCSLIKFQSLEQSLAHCRHSAHFGWKNEWKLILAVLSFSMLNSYIPILLVKWKRQLFISLLFISTIFLDSKIFLLDASLDFLEKISCPWNRVQKYPVFPRHGNFHTLLWLFS